MVSGYVLRLYMYGYVAMRKMWLKLNYDSFWAYYGDRCLGLKVVGVVVAGDRRQMNSLYDISLSEL